MDFHSVSCVFASRNHSFLTVFLRLYKQKVCFFFCLVVTDCANSCVGLTQIAHLIILYTISYLRGHATPAEAFSAERCVMRLMMVWIQFKCNMHIYFTYSLPFRCRSAIIKYRGLWSFQMYTYTCQCRAYIVNLDQLILFRCRCVESIINWW